MRFFFMPFFKGKIQAKIGKFLIKVLTNNKQINQSINQQMKQ
jgi:hypothetical protein